MNEMQQQPLLISVGFIPCLDHCARFSSIKNMKADFARFGGAVGLFGSYLSAQQNLIWLEKRGICYNKPLPSLVHPLLLEAFLQQIVPKIKEISGNMKILVIKSLI